MIEETVPQIPKINLTSEDLLSVIRDGKTVKGIDKVHLQLQALAGIKNVIDFSSWTRKLFLDGNEEIDDSITALTDEFTTEIIVTETVSFSDLKDDKLSRGRMLQRVMDRIRQKIEYAEDEASKKALDSALEDEQMEPVRFVRFRMYAAEKIRYELEKHRLQLDKWLVNRDIISDAILYLGKDIDPVTTRVVLMAGYIGKLLNAAIITSAANEVKEIIPKGEVYGVASPEYLGVFTVHEALSNEFKIEEEQFIWVWKEKISIHIINSKSVVKGFRSLADSDIVVPIEVMKLEGGEDIISRQTLAKALTDILLNEKYSFNPTMSIKVDMNGRILESHEEDGDQVIDKFELHGLSLKAENKQ